MVRIRRNVIHSNFESAVTAGWTVRVTTHGHGQASGWPAKMENGVNGYHPIFYLAIDSASEH